MRLLHLTLSSILLVCLVVDYVQSAAVEPIVTVKQGKLKGKVGVTRGGKRFVQYLGIPYGQKPIRFQEALPAEKWEGVKDGTKFGSPCVQFDRATKGVAGDENCLFLNVFTGQVPPTETSTTPVSTAAKSATPPGSPKTGRKLPVMVYIHGGSFSSQSGSLFGAKYLLDEDVVLVTLNYRLGVLGFLSTGDSESIANLGLRDQILALKWVQDNIEAFGGDKTKVTLVGGSAGGALASYLMLSPLAKGLFARVISQSANAMCPWVIVRKPQQVAHKLAAKLNCNAKTTREIMTCLKGKSLKDIEIARVLLLGFSEDPPVPFAPVVEKWIADKSKAVVPELPQKMFAEGKAANVPWLTGYNSLNGLNLAVANVLTTPKRLAQVDTEWGKLAPQLFHYSQSAPNPANISEQVRQYYFGTARVTEDNKEKLVVALTDRNHVECTAQAALLQAKVAPVYLYTLSYQGSSSFLNDWGVQDKIKLKGVVHNDELLFLFNIGKQSLPELKKGDKDTPFSEKMVKIWTEFAKTGKPVERHDQTEFEWAPVLPAQSTASLRWYNLDSPVQSRGRVQDSPTFRVWESFDLGEENLPSSGNIVIGYTMTEKPGVKPITPKAPLKSFLGTNPTAGPVLVSSSTSKPGSSTGSSLSYGLKPGSSPATPTTASTTTKKPTSTTTTLPAAIQAVFKDDDPYSSTTTTTTKKPGFFSKILG